MQPNTKSTFIHIKAMFVRLTKDEVIVIGHVIENKYGRPLFAIFINLAMLY